MKTIVIKPSEIPQDMYNQVIGFDIETEDKFVWSPICLVSLHKPNTDTMYVIGIKYFEGGLLQEISLDELEILKNFLRTIRATGHNLQFDLSAVLYQWGIEMDVYLDTFIIARLFQEPAQGLKDLSIKCNPDLAGQLRHFNENFENFKPPFTYDIGDEDMIHYSGYDAYLPFVIIKKMAPQIKKYEKVIKLEMSYLKNSIRERANGLRFDLDMFISKVDEMSDEVERKQEELNAILGYEFKTNSTAQKKELLIDDWGLTTRFMTKKKEPSMSQESLEFMLAQLQDQLIREQY